MKKGLKIVIFAALLLVFLGSTGYIAYSNLQYKANQDLYTGLAGEYTQPAVPSQPEAAADSGIIAPITVDFASLKQVNEDVVGWIYCEDSVIHYPILKGEDNDYYLHHSIEGQETKAGSIFMEAANRPDFSDPNSVLYGHHMKDKSMFASIEFWADQAYYEGHPVMWILTPEQDYRLDLFAGYTVSAHSDTYRLFSEGGEEFGEYLKGVKAKSDFTAEVELDAEGRYVMLSTCAYSFEDARYVLHGKLVAADSAGGVPIAGKPAEQ